MPKSKCHFFLLLECGWVFPFVIACSYYAKPNQKILEFLMFQHLIALHIIKHHQHEMLLPWSNVKKSWKTLSGKLIEAILFIYSLHACVQNKKISFVFFAHHDQYISIQIEHIWVQNKDSSFYFCLQWFFTFINQDHSL